MLAVIKRYFHSQLQAQICLTERSSPEKVLFQVQKHHRIDHFNMSKPGLALITFKNRHFIPLCLLQWEDIESSLVFD